MSVPACPIPIQNTKVVMYIAHIWGVRLPAAPMPTQICQAQALTPAARTRPDEAEPGEVLVARHADRANDVAVDVRPGRLHGPAGRLAHALCPFSGLAAGSAPCTTFFRYVTAGRVPSSSST